MRAKLLNNFELVYLLKFSCTVCFATAKVVFVDSLRDF